MYKRGDIVAVEFPFSDGSGIKLRPALIISNAEVESTGDVIIIMISSNSRGNDIAISLEGMLLTEPLPKPSFAKCHRVFSVEAKLLKGKLSALRPESLSVIVNTVVRIIS